jgi:hypothetical protein
MRINKVHPGFLIIKPFSEELPSDSYLLLRLTPHVIPHFHMMSIFMYSGLKLYVSRIFVKHFLARLYDCRAGDRLAKPLL